MEQTHTHRHPTYKDVHKYRSHTTKKIEGYSLILSGRVQGITYSCLYMKFVFQNVAKSE